jgi:hypothetical protein
VKRKNSITVVHSISLQNQFRTSSVAMSNSIYSYVSKQMISEQEVIKSLSLSSLVSLM